MCIPTVPPDCILRLRPAEISADWARHGLCPVGGGLASSSHPILVEQGMASALWEGALPCPISSVAGWARYGLHSVGGGPAGPSHPGLVEHGLASAPWAGALPCPISSYRLSKVRPQPCGRGPCRARPPRAGWAGFGLRPMGRGPAMPNLFMQPEQSMASALWAGALPGPATQSWLSRAWPPPRGRGPCQVQPLVPAQQGMAFASCRAQSPGAGCAGRGLCPVGGGRAVRCHLSQCLPWAAGACGPHSLAGPHWYLGPGRPAQTLHSFVLS